MTALPKTQKTADMIVGERIHLLLFQAGMTRRELALQLAVSEQTLGKKIKAISTFSLDELLTLCQIFDVEITDLLVAPDMPLAGFFQRRKIDSASDVPPPTTSASSGTARRASLHGPHAPRQLDRTSASSG